MSIIALLLRIWMVSAVRNACLSNHAAEKKEMGWNALDVCSGPK